MKKLINLNAINKMYKMGDIEVQALSDVHLSINAGEYVAILGPSGSGKSTLMNILGCLDKPSSGEYCLNEQMVENLSKNELAFIRNKTIGFVFQQFHLLPYLNALENILLPLTYRSNNDEIYNKNLAVGLLQKMGLSDRMYHKPSELSGGQQQRVAIARALMTEPDVILADEPTGNLDTSSGNIVLELFEELSKSGKTIIIVTHDELVAQKANRIISVIDGKVSEREKAPS